MDIGVRSAAGDATGGSDVKRGSWVLPGFVGEGANVKDASWSTIGLSSRGVGTKDSDWSTTGLVGGGVDDGGNSLVVGFFGRVNCSGFFGSGLADCLPRCVVSSGLASGTPKLGRSCLRGPSEESEEALEVAECLKSGEDWIDMSCSAKIQRVSCESTKVGLKNSEEANWAWLTR